MELLAVISGVVPYLCCENSTITVVVQWNWMAELQGLSVENSKHVGQELKKSIQVTPNTKKSLTFTVVTVSNPPSIYCLLGDKLISAANFFLIQFYLTWPKINMKKNASHFFLTA